MFREDPIAIVILPPGVRGDDIKVTILEMPPMQAIDKTLELVAKENLIPTKYHRLPWNKQNPEMCAIVVETNNFIQEGDLDEI